MSKLILVSNRAPVTVRVDGQKIHLDRSSGGLVAGLAGPHDAFEGTWIGWPGELPRLSAAQKRQLEAQLAAIRVVPVYLNRRDIKGFYEEVSNGAVWPVFHYRIDQLPLLPTGWPMYTKVNQAFANEIIRAYQPGDRVWIHDYHLMLTPGMVRQALPDARLGFFLHIPFPSPDVFAVLPWRHEILEGLLGADLIGFHTPLDAEHFLESCRRVLKITPSAGSLSLVGRAVRVGDFPLGIDTGFWSELATRPDIRQRAAEIRDEARGKKILVGIDRLDYTKGLLRRLTAIELLFQNDPELAKRIRLILVVFPSREALEFYASLKRRLDEMVGRINGRYGSTADAPVRVLNRNMQPDEVASLYKAADIMLVTPVRDGMNLVAKEFVATRNNEDGVLVLSEFAGAANELNDAVIVNPFDVEGMAASMRAALDMPAREQKQRMRNLRAKVLRNDVHVWADSFLGALDGAEMPSEIRTA